MRISRQKINGGLNGLDTANTKYDEYLAQGTVTPSLGTPIVPPIAAIALASGGGVPGAVSVPAVPAPPAPPPAQTAQIPVPLNSDKPPEVRIADNRAVGQDLQNRRLAQIATGGVSG